MKNSKLEKKVKLLTRIKREFKEIEFVRLGHYLNDRTWFEAHYHHEGRISKGNLIEHTY